MNYKNRIQSLHRTDGGTAKNIMRQYPAQWDMDRVFQKAYQGYLSQKKESVPMYSELKETAVCTAETRMSHRIGTYVGLAAAMMGAFLLIFQFSSPRLPEGRIPDESSILTQSEAEETMSESAAVSQTAASSYASETIAGEESPTEATTGVTESVIHGSELPESEIMIPDRTEPHAETEAVTTEWTKETTSMDTTTIPPDILQGHFEITGQSNNFSEVIFVSENTESVEAHAHSFAAEGFTVTDVQELHPDDAYHSVVYYIEAESGQQYRIRQFSSLRVGYRFDSDPNCLTIPYQIGEKPAFLLYQEDENADCMLIWYDGCHICFVESPLKNLAEMELLVQSQITY